MRVIILRLRSGAITILILRIVIFAGTPMDVFSTIVMLSGMDIINSRVKTDRKRHDKRKKTASCSFYDSLS